MKSTKRFFLLASRPDDLLVQNILPNFSGHDQFVAFCIDQASISRHLVSIEFKSQAPLEHLQHRAASTCHRVSNQKETGLHLLLHLTSTQYCSSRHKIQSIKSLHNCTSSLSSNPTQSIFFQYEPLYFLSHSFRRARHWRRCKPRKCIVFRWRPPSCSISSCSRFTTSYLPPRKNNDRRTKGHR